MTDLSATPAAAKPTPIEAYGVKGIQGKSWRKTFKTSEALCAWAEKNDAEVFGTREIEVSR